MVLMVLLRTDDTSQTRRRSFVVGEIDCKKDTSEILRNTFMVKQNAALKRIAAESKRFVVVTKPHGSLGIAFGQAAATDTVVADIPLRLFACGDLAFYALVLGRNGMSPIWCWLCQQSKTEWTSEGPSGLEMWTISGMKGKLAENKTGAARKGMVEYLIWDSIEPGNFLFSVLHVQIGLVDNIINWMHSWIDERVENISEEEVTSRKSRIIAENAFDTALENIEH